MTLTLSTDPTTYETEVLIIGAGLAGLCMAARLKEAGQRDFLILEAASEVGGTWRDNTYPGAACDVQSHLYAYSFAPNPDWSRAFAPQQEIQRYIVETADRLSLRAHLRTGREVVRATWSEGQAPHWLVETGAGERYRARVLVSACGGLSQPAYPQIPGLDTFRGERFHTARWRHDVPLEGQRVGIIGTGASAIQVIPSIAPACAHLSVFQRTPPWVLPKPDHPVSERVRRLYRAWPGVHWLERQRIYWGLGWRVLPFALSPKAMVVAAWMGRRFLAESVPDPALRAKLTPTYTIGCKRILMANDYYPALQRANVDVETEGIARVDEAGVWLRDGRHVPLDVLILATGFQAADAGAVFPTFGRDGRSLRDAWSDGPEAYKGTMVHGFPNLYLLVGPNTGLGHSSMIFMIESQVQLVMEALARAGTRASVEVKEGAQARYNAWLQRKLNKTVWASGCNSWYQTASGKNTTLWPSFTWHFRWITSTWDAEDMHVRTPEA